MDNSSYKNFKGQIQAILLAQRTGGQKAGVGIIIQSRTGRRIRLNIIWLGFWGRSDCGIHDNGHRPLKRARMAACVPSDTVLTGYESPADQSRNSKEKVECRGRRGYSKVKPAGNGSTKFNDAMPGRRCARAGRTQLSWEFTSAYRWKMQRRLPGGQVMQYNCI